MVVSSNEWPRAGEFNQLCIESRGNSSRKGRSVALLMRLISSESTLVSDCVVRVVVVHVDALKF